MYAACILLHVFELLVSPPQHLPDLFAVLNVLISTPVFVFAWLWSIKRGIEVGWAMGGLVFPSQPQSHSALQPTPSTNIPFTREISLEPEEESRIRFPRDSTASKLPPLKQLKLKNSRSFGSISVDNKAVLRASSMGPSVT